MDWYDPLFVQLIHSLIGLLTRQACLYSLQSFDASFNQIDDFKEIEHISKLPCLEALVLEGNPIQEFMYYRQQVYSELLKSGSSSSKLSITLDGLELSEKERHTLRGMMFMEPEDMRREMSFNPFNSPISNIPHSNDTDRAALDRGDDVDVLLKYNNPLDKDALDANSFTNNIIHQTTSLYHDSYNSYCSTIRERNRYNRMKNDKRLIVVNTQVNESDVDAISIELEDVEVNWGDVLDYLIETTPEYIVPRTESPVNIQSSYIGSLSFDVPLDDTNSRVDDMISSSSNSNVHSNGMIQPSYTKWSGDKDLEHNTPRMHSVSSSEPSTRLTSMDLPIDKRMRMVKAGGLSNQLETDSAPSSSSPSSHTPSPFGSYMDSNNASSLWEKHLSLGKNNETSDSHDVEGSRHSSRSPSRVYSTDVASSSLLKYNLADKEEREGSFHSTGRDSAHNGTYIGREMYADYLILDNLYTYFNEQVFNTSESKPSGVAPYMCEAVLPHDDQDNVIYVLPPRRPEQFLGLYQEKIIDISNVSNAGPSTEIPVILVLTDVTLYIVLLSSISTTATFKDAPIPVLLRSHELYTLRKCVIFFGIQRCILQFDQGELNALMPLASSPASESVMNSGSLVETFLSASPIASSPVATTMSLLSTSPKRNDNGNVASNNSSNNYSNLAHLASIQSRSQAIVSYMILTRDKSRNSPIITRIPQVSNAARCIEDNRLGQCPIPHYYSLTHSLTHSLTY